jgi:opacity protein-like surface antigen
MFHRKGAALLAASAVLACAGLVRAAEPQATVVAPDSGLSLSRPVYLDDTTPPDSSIMGLANKLGMDKSLTSNGITIGGYVEASTSYNFRNTRFNTGHVFDFENQDPTLNQFVVFIDKQVDTKSKSFNIGGRVEMMYGADARLIHANGVFDHYGVGDGPNNQFDPTQFYLDFFVPVGNGLTIRAGKFVTLLGQEVINPTQNALYSHSYLFGFAIPFTHTGVYGTYSVNDAWTFDLGVSRGWEQGFEDNNHDSIDVFGRATWTINAKTGTKLLITGIGGPEQAGNSGDYRYLLDVIFTTKISDNLTATLNGDWGYENHAGNDGGAAQWYGVAGYLGYAINDMFTVNFRGEWFDDADGARGLGTLGSVYEATLGLDIKPLGNNKNFASLHIRPEIRYDYSAGAFFAGGTKHDQWTAAVDAVFGF